MWSLEGQKENDCDAEIKALMKEFNANFADKSIDFSRPTFQPDWTVRMSQSEQKNDSNSGQKFPRRSVSHPESNNSVNRPRSVVNFGEQQIGLRQINASEYEKIKSEATRRVSVNDIPSLPNNMIRFFAIKHALN